MFGITENFQFVKRETGSQERKTDFVYGVDRTKRFGHALALLSLNEPAEPARTGVKDGGGIDFVY